MSHSLYDDSEIEEVAVIGMSCRFPESPDLKTFWKNLCEGRNCIKHFQDEDLPEVTPEILARRDYVRARGIISESNGFDAAFFGMTPREAETVDPQQRVFLECAWSAIEDAGHVVPAAGAPWAVFGGVGPNHYGRRIVHQGAVVPDLGMLLELGNERDHVTPRLSYLLNLTGPSIPVHTACSTSLVAVHLACQSLLNYEADVALAGGCSLPYPVHQGYLFREGGILSADGFCRAYDAGAGGTVPGSGAGVVVLKRLSEAVRDRDHIYAVIRGSAVNNDGAAKVGYTAPGVGGQRRVILQALAAANVNPRDISMVEGHGTATALGDPIEVRALNQAFAQAAEQQLRPASCALGSVKTNLGHCDTAAGIAGFIKTVLCLFHRRLVPSLHFEAANPEISFEEGPFYVSVETKPWLRETRLAGVSSFGIGGTNAHVILSQAPAPNTVAVAEAPYLMTLSAKSSSALAEKSRDLRHFIQTRENVPVAQIALNANRGRRAFSFRRAFAFRDREQLLERLGSGENPERPCPARRLVFLFPGQGSDHWRLDKTFYEKEKTFRKWIDACCQILEPMLGANFKSVLFAGTQTERDLLKKPTHLQPALFVGAFALAKWWLSRGLRADAFMGHSVGEYVAATLAGVFRLEDVLRLLYERGRLTAKIPEGAMLAVPLDVDQVRPYLSEDVALAAENGPRMTVLSGPIGQINRLSLLLGERGIHAVPLSVSHAFHSVMMAPAMEPLTAFAAKLERKPPQHPLVSNLTGTWMTETQALDPAYWARHMRETVQFNRGLQTLFEEGDYLFLEVGRGSTLTKLIRQHPDLKGDAYASWGKQGIWPAATAALAGLWRQGAAVDWLAFYGEEPYARMSLPTYPFERQTHCLAVNKTKTPVSEPDSQPQERAGDVAKQAFSQWFYLPYWQPAPLSAGSEAEVVGAAEERWLIFADRGGLAEQLCGELNLGQALLVYAGDHYERLGDREFQMVPGRFADYQRLLEVWAIESDQVVNWLHLWLIDPPAGKTQDRIQYGFDSLCLGVRAMEQAQMRGVAKLTLFTRGLAEVGPVPDDSVVDAACRGLMMALPKELPRFRCRHLDLGARGHHTPVARIAAELIRGDDERVAYRGERRWLPALQQGVPVQPVRGDRLASGACYLLSNGLQLQGFALAEYLHQHCEARIVFLDNTFIPEQDEWDNLVADAATEPFLLEKLTALSDLRSKGVDFRIVTANAAELERLRTAAVALGEVGREIHTVFHFKKPALVGLIQAVDRPPSRILNTKWREFMNLNSVFPTVRQWVLFADNEGEQGIGHAEQAAVYALFARFAQKAARTGGPRVLALGGTMAAWQDSAEVPDYIPDFFREQLRRKRESYGISLAESIRVLQHALALGEPHVIISSRDYGTVLAQSRETTLAAADDPSTRLRVLARSREELTNPYAPPESELEVMILNIWQAFFGLEKIGIHDNFFELGGHSMLAVQLLVRLNETFSHELTMQSFVEMPTIAEQARFFTQNQPEAEDLETIESILNEIEGLSEGEIETAMDSDRG